MAMEFRLPNLTGSADEKIDIAELRRFLFQHIQQLNVALGQLEQLMETGSQTQAQAAQSGQGEIVKKVLAQTGKEYVRRSQFDRYIRMGLLGQDDAGQHYGVDIGHTESTEGGTVFLLAARLEPGASWLYDGSGNKVLGVVGSTVRIGSYTIETSGGKITID
jgi:hypothetical protein|nr:MAG TPA_asm: hypothetical protein [Caudoviricetes sp.]